MEDRVITVRRISADQAPWLRTVRLAALTDSPSAFGSSLDRELAFADEEWHRRALASSSGDERLTLLAWDGDEVVGIVSGLREPARPETVDLVSMWTRPSVRRSGVGIALVRGVLEWARSTGAARVELWVVQGNTPARRLYARLGFEVTTHHPPRPDDPCAQEVRMVHHLGSPHASTAAMDDLVVDAAAPSCVRPSSRDRR